MLVLVLVVVVGVKRATLIIKGYCIAAACMYVCL